MSQFDVIGVGVNVVDILVQLPSRVEIGGKQKVEHLTIQGGGPAGTGSCVCAALGWRTAFVTQFGDNMLSQVARLEFETRGILPDLFLENPQARPCAANVHIDPHTAERTIFFTRDGYQYLRPADLPAEIMKTARILLVDGYEPEAAQASLEAIQGTPCRSVLDVEQGDVDELLRLIALATDAILPMATARILTGKNSPEDVLRALSRETSGQLVVTEGTLGSWALTPEGIIHQPAFQVTAIDTTGCGDVFHGAYAAGILAEMPLAVRLEFSAWLASLTACFVGGRTGIPRQKELASLDQSRLSSALKQYVSQFSQRA
ncbi:ribokinase [Candidatus Vecturithrix granuli]|uniref:Ribokinase n=1 Tax=Vecturithrix granuli TaxID=1499967 RepID=A0A081C1G5_VECG1|nr:ribokinase [Candidatus Vecturithrix granuli]